MAWNRNSIQWTTWKWPAASISPGRKPSSASILPPRSILPHSPHLPTCTFTFPAGRSFEYLRDEQGQAIGVIVREWETLTGSIQLKAEQCRDGIVKVTVRVRNLNSFDPMDAARREAASALFAGLCPHHPRRGAAASFISLLDPPAGLEDLASSCNNVGTWPVLVGDPVGDGVGGQAEMVLSSPIILYDHPQIAPESAGNLFDSTEIDEILSLRILTLTDDEKREMRQSDDRAREILERTENMPEEQFMKLHGVLRGLTPLKEEEAR